MKNCAIFCNTITTKGRTLRRLEKKFVLCTVKVFNQNLMRRKWFARIRSGNFNLKDNSRSGCPISEKADKIRENLQKDSHKQCRYWYGARN